MTRETNTTHATLAQWFKVLLICQLVELGTELLDLFGLSGGVTVWTSRFVAAVVVAVLFRLAGANARYRKAAVLCVVALCGGIVSVWLQMSGLVLVLSVVGIVASYHEYNAHSELTAPLDAKLSARWHSLFTLELFGGLAVALVGSIPVTVAAVMGSNAEVLTDITVGCVGLVYLLLDALHALYLKQTLAHYEAQPSA